MLRLTQARRATEKGEQTLTVARSRWQTGWLIKRGKRKLMWVGRYREDALDENGRRVRIQRAVVLGPVRQLGKREARRMLAERLAAINQGRHKPELLVDFERFVVERWEPNILPTLRFSTARNYRHLIRRHLLPFFGQVRLAEIGPADVQMFLAEKAKRFAPKTVLALRNLLSKIFGTAQRWGYLQQNPARGAQVPALVTVRERRALTPEQVRALLDVLKEPYRTMVLLAVLSGLRRGELFALRWKAVDFGENSILVTETLYEGRSAPPKTRASRRKVFVAPLVMEALRRLGSPNAQAGELVFATERGTPLNANNVRNRVLIPACRRAGIPAVGWHDFRYTYATWADPTGESIKALQAQLGHTDSQLTLSVYTQPVPESQRQVAAKVTAKLLPVAPRFGPEGGVPGALLQ